MRRNALKRFIKKIIFDGKDNFYSIPLWKIKLFKNEFSKENWSTISLFGKLDKEFYLNEHRNLDHTALVSNRCFIKILDQEIAEIILNNEYKYYRKNVFENHIHLSEDFMEKWFDKLDKYELAMRQVLSENFIRKHADRLQWNAISRYQKLTESFIDEFSDYVDWCEISKCQILSFDFIMKHIDLVDKEYVLSYQKLTEKQAYEIKKSINFLYNFERGINNRLSPEQTKKNIKELGLYTCYDDYFIAYKAIAPDRFSLFNFQYKYEKNGIYESHCDCTSNDISFGLSVGSKKYAVHYGNASDRGFKLIRCKVKYEDVGRIVHGGEKIRCFKIEVLD